jgi:hypothetical protein
MEAVEADSRIAVTEEVEGAAQFLRPRLGPEVSGSLGSFFRQQNRAIQIRQVRE